MSPRFVCIARVGDLYTAEIVAARLQSEGLTVRVHGEALGPYPMTIGQMAQTEIWVAGDDADTALEVLEEAGIECVEAG